MKVMFLQFFFPLNTFLYQNVAPIFIWYFEGQICPYVYKYYTHCSKNGKFVKDVLLTLETLYWSKLLILAE